MVWFDIRGSNSLLDRWLNRRVLLNPDNRRYAFTDLLRATIANWNIIIERTAAIQEQDPLGFAGVPEMMEQFRKTAKQWNAAANKANKQRRDEGGPGVGQGQGGYQKELAKQQKRKRSEQDGE